MQSVRQRKEQRDVGMVFSQGCKSNEHQERNEKAFVCKCAGEQSLSRTGRMARQQRKEESLLHVIYNRTAESICKPD